MVRSVQPKFVNVQLLQRSFCHGAVHADTGAGTTPAFASAAVSAAGGNVAAIANATAAGAMTAAQFGGANVGAIANAASQGAIAAVSAAGGNIAAVANAIAQGSMQAAQAAGADITAREIVNLHNGVKEASSHQIKWDGKIRPVSNIF